MVAIERLTDPVYAVGESPVWNAGEGALYFVDIPAKQVLKLDPAKGGKPQAWTAPEMVACIAFDHHGGLIAGLETGFFGLKLQADGTAAATRLAAPTFPMPQMRFNDGRCDRQGRFWAGTMHLDIPAGHPVGELYRYDERGMAGPLEKGLLTQNGLAWSPSGDRMYLSDSNPKTQLIWSFDYDTATGTPSNKRLFVDMNPYPGRPDGAAVDADGCYWTCANDAGKLLRFTPEGELDRAIDLPAKKPAMCAFGGANFDTLYVTSIRPGNPADLADQPDAGAVFALRPGVRGLPEPRFGTP